MAKALNELTIAEARDGLRGGEFTASELTDACLDKACGCTYGCGIFELEKTA